MSPRRRYTTRLLAGSAFACFAIAAPPPALTPAGLTTASSAPNYSAAGIVNAATQNGETLAPNTVATIYGTNLSWTTHALAARDLNDGTLPTSLEGVSVYVNGILSNLYYVSPGQINFLIPYDLTVSTAIVYVARQGVAGPGVKIPLARTSPGFFEWNGNYAVAQHVDGTLISASHPAAPGEIVVLYAGGLGRTSPDVPSGHIVSGPTSILYESELQILLNGDPCPASSIYYAGLAPDYAGLYQINLLLPDVVPPDPAIRMVMGTQSSPVSVLLYVQ
jgi:uncharacterized protein (TIGR03437 family)